MILRPGVHRYDRKRYPKSRLPGPATLMVEVELAAEGYSGATIRAGYDAHSPHDATTRRGNE